MSDPRGEVVRVEGLAELQRDLLRADVEFTAGLKALHHDNALMVAADANTYVPVGETGKLAMSIGFNVRARSAAVTAGSRSVPYAAPIHWGWPAHNIVPTKFIYKAFDADRGEIIASYEAFVEKTTSRVGRV